LFLIWSIQAMTRVVRFHAIGGPEVLRIEDVDVPPPGADEVRIRVKVLGLNRAESMFRRGVYIISPKFPERLGYEAAGIVDTVGRNVKGFEPGDAVSVVPSLLMPRWPAYGELATFPAELVVKHPSNLSWKEAAAAWMQYITAYGALIDVAKLAKGDFVVITAASSSVGVASIQIANMIGATPIATTRTGSKKQAILEAGAAHVIATEEEDLVARLREITGPAGARVVFDPIGGPGVERLTDAMASGGILIEYGLLSGEPTPFPLFNALVKSLTLRGFIYSEIVANAHRLAAAKSFILEGLTSGALKPLIAKTFTFDQIVEAHRYLESNQQMGKIVVTI
jgi:NADPH:quinone reductase-like Zn-dependent oxidoreductase